MYLMYVDESGDCGLPGSGSPTKYFCLTGLVVHELRWLDVVADILEFRRWLKQKYGIYLDEELHAGEMINKPKKTPKSIRSLRKYERLAVIRNFADAIARLSDVSLINVVVDKQKYATKDEIFRKAWYVLFQRFENTIRYQNFPGPRNADERGLVFADETDSRKLRVYLTKMRQRNPLMVKQRSGAFAVKDEPIRVIIEDPVVRDSRLSYLIQAADCATFVFKQYIEPSAFMKRHGGNAYLNRLGPVLCKHASLNDPMGIVRV